MGNFKREGVPGSFAHHFSAALKDGREMCLEACLNGYCVGVFRDKELLQPKICTNIEGMLEMQIAPWFSMGMGEALKKAIKIANKIVKQS